MIRHIVFFSAVDPADVPRIVEALGRYRDIPSVSRLEVAANEKRDALSGDIDVVLHVEFETEADLAAYKAHPIYAAGTAVVRPLRGLRHVADYTVPKGGGPLSA